jgi:phage replication O-like protein O
LKADGMKNPQLEDGFTRIANELFEAILGFDFSERQLKVLLTIVRKTYGYGKKEDDMSASQIGKVCNIDRSNVTRVLGQLEKMKVITKRHGGYGMIIGINKSHQEWAKEMPSTSAKLTLVSNEHSVSVTLAEVVSIQPSPSVNVTQADSVNVTHTKENLPKENQQKKTRASRGGQKINFNTWMSQVKEQGIKPIPEDHDVFSYAEKIHLPIDYVRLCWLEFKVEHATNSDKKQKSWPQTFSNYVRKNYYRLWFDKDGQWLLTTRGIQLQKEMRDAK